MLATTAAVLAGVVGVMSVNARTPTPAEQAVPETVSGFQLTDTTRLAHTLSYYKYAPAIVLMSQTNGSQFSRESAAELARLQNTYKDRGVLFFMINSNPADSREAAAAEAASNRFAVPVLMDDTQLVGEQLGVRREGEVFVLDPKNGFRIAYHGPLDDRFARDSRPASARLNTAYAKNALDAVLGGSAVSTPRVAMTAGRTISFPERDRTAEHANISYAQTVAPILQAKCVTCHQRGGIAPFAMDSYEVVKGFAPMIREAVMSRRMPPYFADPHVGAFSNDTSLSADQTRTLIHWIEAGAPRGQGDDILKTQASEAPEWPANLGQPDYIVQLPSFSVPASGTIPYQMMTVDNPFPGDVWLRAVAFKPGARPVLHHITSSYSADRTRPPASIPGSSVGSFVPGAGVQVYNEGTGAPVPAGGKLRYSMHYTATGRAMTDATQIGYYVLRTPPGIIRRAAVISDAGMRIPAGEARHREAAYLELPADIVLYSVHPHAHYRGYSVELSARTPDGREVPLLSVPKYDFNWQLDYDLAEPMTLRAGTRLIVRWTYDNSEHNLANPDPRINVTWGEQTWQEMMYFRVNYRWLDETSTNVRNDLQTKLMDTRTFGSVDDNADGRVQPYELNGAMAAARARFGDLDLNHDGGLDRDEFAAGNITRTRARAEDEDSEL
jgi:hypothetical protein